MGRVIALVSGKDGTGKSTTAANLAATLALDFSHSVALVDLDLQTGDQALMFRLPTYPCIDDLVENFEALTLDVLRESMQRANGLSILIAPPTPERADIFRPAHVREILQLLASGFDYVVVDVASHLGDITLEAIDCADLLVLLTTARLASMKDTKRLLRVLADLGKDRDLIVAVLNDTSRVRMSREVIENSINFPISLQLPNASDALLEAAIDGVPLSLSEPRSDIARVFIQLAGLVSVDQSTTVEPSASPGWKQVLHLGARPVEVAS